MTESHPSTERRCIDRRPQDDLSEAKSTLRRKYRELRKAQERRQRQQDAAQLNQYLLGVDAVESARWVAGYLAFDGEPDIRFSLTQLCRRGTGVALPVLPDTPGGRLRFHRWTPATPLKINRHGVSEPRDSDEIPLDRFDVLLLPVVAFDRTGNRLGVGAGWYDRTLADADQRAARIGIAWSRQEAPSLPVEQWDQPLHAVVTEDEWFTCTP